MVEYAFLFTGGLTLAYMTKLFVAIFVEENADEEFEMPTLENFPVPPPQGPDDYRDDEERKADLAFRAAFFEVGVGLDRTAQHLREIQKISTESKKRLLGFDLTVVDLTQIGHIFEHIKAEAYRRNNGGCA